MAGDAQEVKQKSDIVTLISGHVDLKKAGRNFKGNCPFHNEKTPSFVVSPELQMYKCFGCGVSGDIFTFLQEYEGMDFTEALNFLAEKAGVTLKKQNLQAKGEKDKLYEVNKLTMRLYKYVLLKHKLGHDALTYLKKDRGLKMSTIERFDLGFSPNDPRIIRSVLMEKKKISVDDLVKAGIFYKGRSGAFDRFRGRVIFPLHDHRENVCGFAGRLMPGDPKEKKLAKYVNSPETPIYHKSNLFYALNITKDAIRKSKTAVIMEGELDAISSWQAGINNVIAVKGSALTDDQARLIRRFAEKLNFAMDNDDAGKEAVRKAVTVAQNYELDVSVSTLGDYKDPDEVAQKNPDELKKFLENPIPAWDYIIDIIFEKYDVQTGAGKTSISREVIPVLAQIKDKIVQAHYVGYVAKKLRVNPEVVSEQLSAAQSKNTSARQIQEIAESKESSRESMLENRLLSLIFILDPKIFAKKDVASLFTTPLNKKIIKKYLTFKTKNTKFDSSEFEQYLPSELKAGYVNALLVELDATEEKLEDEMESVIHELNIETTKLKLNEISDEIKSLEKGGSGSKLAKKQKEFGDLVKKLSELRNRS